MNSEKTDRMAQLHPTNSNEAKDQANRKNDVITPFLCYTMVSGRVYLNTHLNTHLSADHSGS